MKRDVWIGVVPKGLEEALELQLKDQKLEFGERKSGQVPIFASIQDLYPKIPTLSSLSKLLYPLSRFKFRDIDEFKYEINHIDWKRFYKKGLTLKVDSTSKSQHLFRNEIFISQVVKDVICDQLVRKVGHRPDVDLEKPDIPVYIRILQDECWVSVDAIGESLAHHGWRRYLVQAPLRENLAAGLLSYSGWTGDKVLVDPMCGSGTFCIEAALQFKNSRPYLNKSVFMRWPKFVDFNFPEAPKRSAMDYRPMIYGFDIDPAAIQIAQKNAEIAGVEDLIHFEKRDLNDFASFRFPQGIPGIIIMNPPYGERINFTDQDETIYQFGKSLRQNFQGWELYVLSGDPEALKKLNMKASRKWPVWNGTLECRFLKYDIRSKPQP